MATATRETVKKDVVKTEEVPVIRLELSEEEANKVQALIGGLAGIDHATTNVRNALRDAGARGWWHDYYEIPEGSNTWHVLKTDN